MAAEIPIIRSATANTIRVSHPVIPSTLLTYLNASNVATDTTLTVLDNNGTAQNDFLIIGKLGIDKTEILRITGVVTQGTSLTVGALSFDHPIDTVVQKVLWDQIELSGATTATGSKTVITTISIQPDRVETTYINTGTTYAFYFVRFKNSQTSTFSSYSDPAPAGGFATNSVRAIKDTALANTGEKISSLITDDFLNQEIFNCEQEVWSEKKQWSWSYTFDYILGDTVLGGYSVSLPSDISDFNSNKSILGWDGVRIGTLGSLSYMTKEEMDRFYMTVRHTTLATSFNAGAVSIVLADSSDFDATGSITIGANTYTYTANTISTGTLTVPATAQGETAGVDVWQNVTFGTPSRYTVVSGKVYFDVPVNSTYATKNIYLNYYRKPTTIDTDNDTVNIPDFTLYHYYLAWKILLKKNNGVSTPEIDGLRQLYEKRKLILGRQDRTQRKTWRPRLNNITQLNTDPYIKSISISGSVTQI